jgi:pilus assembly protein TadC
MTSEDDLAALLKRYVRQETIDPLRTIGRTLLFGVLGSLLLGVGAVLSAIGSLRLLQGWGPLDDTWSFVPYLLVAVALVVLCAIALQRVSRSAGTG